MGLLFPAKKQDILRHAGRSGAGPAVMRILDRVEGWEFASIAELMQAVGEIERNMQDGRIETWQAS